MDAETAAKQLVEMSYSEWKSLDEQSREMLARAVTQDANAAAEVLEELKQFVAGRTLQDIEAILENEQGEKYYLARALRAEHLAHPVHDDAEKVDVHSQC